MKIKKDELSHQGKPAIPVLSSSRFIENRRFPSPDFSEFSFIDLSFYWNRKMRLESFMILYAIGIKNQSVKSMIFVVIFQVEIFNEKVLDEGPGNRRF